MRRLEWKDWLLLGCFLPLACLIFALHVDSVLTTGLAQAPALVGPATSKNDYPVVSSLPVVEGPSSSVLQVGDRILWMNGRAMRGAGLTRFRAKFLEFARETGSVEVELEREGRVEVVQVEPLRPSLPWARIPALLAVAVSATLVLLRSRDTGWARLLFVGAVGLCICEAPFPSGRLFRNLLQEWLLIGGVALFAPILLSALMSIPSGGRLPALVRRLWCGAFFVAYLGVRLSGVRLGMLPPQQVLPGVLILDVLMLGSTLFAVGWSYQRAEPAGRRRLQWLYYGAFAGITPLAAAVLASLLLPDFAGTEALYAIGALSLVLVPIGLCVALVREGE